MVSCLRRAPLAVLLPLASACASLPESAQENDRMVDTRLSVTELNTVDPGPLEILASYTDLEGTPIPGARVTATGDSAILPITLEQAPEGDYRGVATIPPDFDGRRHTIMVKALKADYAPRTAYLAYFTGDPTWIVRNDHVERQLLAWKEKYPQYLSLEWVTSYEGYRTYLVTLTDSAGPSEQKLKVLFVQSHAHEPGGTAAIVDVIHQLLTGTTQEGEPTELDRERILEKMLLAFIPIGNASGRERSPVQYWSEQYDAATMNSFIYGHLAGASTRWMESPSVLVRSQHDLEPAYPTPLRYEQIDEDTFVEPFFAMLPRVPPNRLPAASRFPEILADLEEHPGYKSAQGHFVKTLLDRHVFHVGVDMHQMTTPGDSGQVYIREKGEEGYDQARLEYAHQLAGRILEDWKAQGFVAGLVGRASSGIKPLTADGWPMNITDFIHLYGRGHPASFMVEITKGPGTTKPNQKGMARSAMESVVSHLLDTGAGLR